MPRFLSPSCREREFLRPPELWEAGRRGKTEAVGGGGELCFRPVGSGVTVQSRV